MTEPEEQIELATPIDLIKVFHTVAAAQVDSKDVARIRKQYKGWQTVQDGR